MSTTTSGVIPADHITFTDDGHAWWVCKPVHRAGVTNTVGDDYDDPSWFMWLDRPCDTCGGQGFLYMPEDGIPCEADCIDGRHTFDIEVECAVPMCANGVPGYWEDGGECGYCEGTTIRKLRVSVVPGMVLPVNAILDLETAAPQFLVDEDGDVFGVGVGVDDGDDFPPAAAPGTWAVKLRVARKVLVPESRDAEIVALRAF